MERMRHRIANLDSQQVSKSRVLRGTVATLFSLGVGAAAYKMSSHEQSTTSLSVPAVPTVPIPLEIPTTTQSTLPPAPPTTVRAPRLRAARAHVAPQIVSPTMQCSRQEGRAAYEDLAVPSWYMHGGNGLRGIHSDYKNPAKPELDLMTLWPTIRAMGCDLNVNPVLIPAILQNETYGSGVKPSPKGAKGPMQFLESTWESYTVIIRNTPQFSHIRDKYGISGNINSLLDAAFYALVYTHRLEVPKGIPSLTENALPRDYFAGVQSMASKYNGGWRYALSGPQKYGHRVAAALEALMRG